MRFRFVLGVERNVAFGPDLDGVGFERFFLIENERQNFVIDRDVAQRFFGGVPVDGGDGGDGFAHEAHRIVEGVAALFGDLLDVVGVLAAAGDGARAPDELAVLVRDHGLDAGHGERLSKRRCDGCARAGEGCGARCA